MPKKDSRHRKGKWLRPILTAMVLFAAFIWLNNTNLFIGDVAGKPKLLAHRGLSQTFDVSTVQWDTNTAEIIYPPEHDFLENTVRSMDEAFRLGASVVELDIHRTKDDRLAVFHDYLADYRTDRNGPISDFTMGELKLLDIGYGYTADGGMTYPFRGLGVGQMPELDEILSRYVENDLLIHIKDGDEHTARLFSERLSQMDAERLGHIQCYGDEEAMRYIREHVPGLRVMSAESLKGSIIQYIAIGWTGIVPESLKGTQIHLPIEYAHLLWGWPARFMQRMDEVGTRVVLVKGVGGYSQGFDTMSDLEEVPNGFSGYVWTNRIDRLADASREAR